MTVRYEEDHRQHSTRPTRTTVDSAHAKRTRGEDPAPSPHHEFNGIPANYREINGWGADLDPKNRPSFPMEYPSDVKTVRGPVKHWQQPRTKIHQSNEQPGLTPVFGESVPPRGLSGLLRDYAYQYGEGTTRHWMTLMLADRVDIVESMVVDAFRGRPDNYVKEKAGARSSNTRTPISAAATSTTVRRRSVRSPSASRSAACSRTTTIKSRPRAGGAGGRAPTRPAPAPRCTGRTSRRESAGRRDSGSARSRFPRAL